MFLIVFPAFSIQIIGLIKFYMEYLRRMEWRGRVRDGLYGRGAGECVARVEGGAGTVWVGDPGGGGVERIE